jgi:hypothetical protein
VFIFPRPLAGVLAALALVAGATALDLAGPTPGAAGPATATIVEPVRPTWADEAPSARGGGEARSCRSAPIDAPALRWRLGRLIIVLIVDPGDVACRRIRDSATPQDQAERRIARPDGFRACGSAQRGRRPWALVDQQDGRTSSRAPDVLVVELSQCLVELFRERGAASSQIGRTYPYLEALRPEAREWLQMLKRHADPDGLVNPGVLGLQ